MHFSFLCKKEQLKNINIETQDIFNEAFASQSYDVIHCCLFTHHFSSDELVSLFRQWKQQARFAIIINDLHRHFLAYHSIKWLTRLWSKSYMVQNDAPLSVARGFYKKELQDILRAAGLVNYQLTWKWAFRWQLVILT